jgi:hypothetical protein
MQKIQQKEIATTRCHIAVLTFTQVTLIVSIFTVFIFTYPQFYFTILRSNHILFVAMVEAAAQAYRVAHAVSLTCSIILTSGTTDKGFS